MLDITLRVSLIIAIIIYFISIFIKLKRKQLILKYSLVWLFTGIILAIMVCFPGLLMKVANAVGIKEEMNGLFVFAFVFVFVFAFFLILILTCRCMRLYALPSCFGCKAFLFTHLPVSFRIPVYLTSDGRKKETLVAGEFRVLTVLCVFQKRPEKSAALRVGKQLNCFKIAVICQKISVIYHFSSPFGDIVTDIPAQFSPSVVNGRHRKPPSSRFPQKPEGGVSAMPVEGLYF